MAFACQKNSYAKEFKAQVVSCKASQLKLNAIANTGKKETIDGFEVILSDTVLFPEGGGQPSDQGTIGEEPVVHVFRRGAEAIHFTRSEFKEGDEVHLKVDWKKRFDHMQQHSGQHLITAIADQVYKFPTTSWNLGQKVSFIELGTPMVSEEQMEDIEQIVNEKIRDCVPMFPTLYESKDDPKLLEARTRGLPDDHVGPVRVVTIEGIETNMCCGTHVSNLSHLQSIKLLSCEKGKKNKCNLFFVAGNRVLEYLGRCYNNEKKLIGMLKVPPEEHIESVERLQKSIKLANKTTTQLLRDVAALEVEKFNSQTEKPRVLFMHRKDGDNEFMNTLSNGISDDTLKFVSTGDEKGSGMFLLSGKEDIVNELAPKVLEVLEGKGAGKNGKLQGKASKLKNLPLVEKLIREKVKCES